MNARSFLLHPIKYIDKNVHITDATDDNKKQKNDSCI